MEQKIIHQKQITQLIAEKKRIRCNDVSILTADINHIVVKDIIELYLKLNFCRRISWVDTNGNQLKTNNLFTNIWNVLLNIIYTPIIKNKVEKAIFKEESIGNTNPIKFNQKINLQYIRTDHWFNLKSGGSVGHTSGVINSLIKKGVLYSVLSSSKLFNVKWENNYQLAKPDYLRVANIPNLPELAYNLELMEKYFTTSKNIDFNAIYQRYSLGNFYGVYLRRKYNLPLILEFNGSELWVSKNWNNKKVYFYDLLKKIEHVNLKFADKIIVVSEVLKTNLMKEGIDGTKILVNPNGVDTTIYQPNCGGTNLKETLGIANQNIVGFIGTFGAWHGAIVMANAIKIYFQKYTDSNTIFLLIGEGNDLPEVKKIIKEAGCEDKIIFTGRIDQTEGPKYLDACDILLSPHIPNPDGTAFFGSPTKLFEYMSMGKAIIASNLNQIGEILEHKKTALLIEPNNAILLADTINELILDKKLQHYLGFNAREEVINNYSWEKHVERILKFVQER